jgi:glycosyltransferase involved in cell wall biosynthesis
VAATDAPYRIADPEHSETGRQWRGQRQGRQGRVRGPEPSLTGTSSVGLVHDYLLVLRGAERSFAAIADCWREAPIYTLLHDPRALEGHFAGHEIHTSPLQRLGIGQASFRRLLPLYPLAMGRLDARAHDLVVSSNSAFAHGVHTREDAQHICYCYTPFRYAWHERERTLAEAPRALRPLLGGTLRRVRDWDREASRRVSGYIAISKLSQQRIGECYGREASIVHPPVDVERFSIGAPEEWFLTVSELVAHKRTEVAIEGARRIGAPIKVVGTGPEYDTLRRRYGASVEFLGRVDDATLAGLYRRARALIVPGVEEFGIAAVEAQASGRPVVASASGGACETVLDGTTGVLVPDANPDDFAQALRDTDFDAFSPQRIRAHALQFSVAGFKRRFRAEVERMLAAPLTA